MFFGLLHAALLWHGDILFMYGLFGLLLLPFFFRKDKTIKVWSILIYSLYAVGLTLIAILLFAVEQLLQEDINFEFSLSQLDGVMLNGSYLDSIFPRLDLWIWGLIGSGLFLQGGLAFAAFLIGIRAARNSFLTDSAKQAQLKKAGLFGLLLGLPVQMICATVYVSNEQSNIPSGALYVGSLMIAFAAAPFLSVSYVWLVLKLISVNSKFVTLMAAAGRMSLSTYIGQSVIASLIFGAWGFGLFQQLQMWQLLILVFLIWLTQLYIANSWLSRFSQGPLEWVLAMMTRTKSKPLDGEPINTNL
jgi:uncharacterized protein